MLQEIVEIESRGVNLDTEVCANHCSKSVIFTQDTSIWSAMQQIKNFKRESLPVVYISARGKMLGVIFESSIINGFLSTLEKVRDEEHGAQ